MTIPTTLGALASAGGPGAALLLLRAALRSLDAVRQLDRLTRATTPGRDEVEHSPR